MGATAARKALKVLRNSQQVLGIELVLACQTIDLGTGELGRGTGAAYRTVREAVPRLIDDRVVAADLAAGFELVTSGAVLDAVKK